MPASPRRRNFSSGVVAPDFSKARDNCLISTRAKFLGSPDFTLFGATSAHTHVLFAFPTMLGMLAWKLLVVSEAGYSEGKVNGPETSNPLPWLTHPVLAATLIAGAVLPTVARLKAESGFAALRITSRWPRDLQR